MTEEEKYVSRITSLKKEVYELPVTWEGALEFTLEHKDETIKKLKTIEMLASDAVYYLQRIK